MPINLTRRNLLQVQRNPYFLAEKSDGVRYLLYVVSAGAAHGGGAAGAGAAVEAGQPVALLVNRSCSVFALQGAAAIGAALRVVR